jgi:uncharacterized protein YceK
MRKTQRLALLLALPALGGCGMFYTVDPVKHKAQMAAGHTHDDDDDTIWTCPHEGGVFHKPGKCPNSWCGLDLVPKKN